MAPDLETRVVLALDSVQREMYELRVKVERLLADQEARDTVCRITHESLNGRLKRHSDGLVSVRGEQDSMHEEFEETTKTGLQAPKAEHPQVTVARWAAISAIGVALVAGGFVAGLAKLIVAALAHAMGIGG